MTELPSSSSLATPTKGYQKGPDVKREREQSVHARNAMLQRVAWDSKKNADNRSF